MDVFEAMESAMTMRWLTEEPVPDELIEKLIWAGTRAANPANAQLWDFIVVKSPEQRALLHETMISPEVRARLESLGGAGASPLATLLRDAPVLIFICVSSLVPGDPREDRYKFSALYGAAQNMIVAARALGLGVTPTGLHHFATKGVRELLNVPDHKIIGVTMPVGWAARPFRPVKRKPIADVIHFDTW
ncbi:MULTISPECIES: nitroreductase family protein [Streptomyces]|uniref:nitroreductase family protein n=1 Tax=Streptomyces lycopersici TaxID=2974589 RepID=UPI0021D09956|nr:nitroreductase family protein [Streptomyces sp. NEAU-383]